MKTLYPQFTIRRQDRLSGAWNQEIHIWRKAYLAWEKLWFVAFCSPISFSLIIFQTDQPFVTMYMEDGLFKCGWGGWWANIWKSTFQNSPIRLELIKPWKMAFCPVFFGHSEHLFYLNSSVRSAETTVEKRLWRRRLPFPAIWLSVPPPCGKTFIGIWSWLSFPAFGVGFRFCCWQTNYQRDG